jgi:beta-RFAP synthase
VTKESPTSNRDDREDAVFVETAGRLHLGVLDLGRSRGRWFGGVGAAAPAPTLLVSAAPAEGLQVEGDEAARAEGFVRDFLAHHRLPARVHVRVHRALPAHAGLGSGTQLALAVGRALAEVYGVAADAPALARAVGRARRSAVGTWTFAGGGLVVEGGRRDEVDECGPLLSRIFFPTTWRAVVAVPHASAGMSGAAEAAAFAALPAPDEREVHRVAHLVLMALLPAVADADLHEFGAALTEIQETTGRWFASVQGGTFAAGPSARLVQVMRDCGARGVGQSSWGPAVYGVVDGQEAGVEIAQRVRRELGSGGTVYEGPFRREGARVWRRAGAGVAQP